MKEHVPFTAEGNNRKGIHEKIQRRAVMVMVVVVVVEVVLVIRLPQKKIIEKDS